MGALNGHLRTSVTIAFTLANVKIKKKTRFSQAAKFIYRLKHTRRCKKMRLSSDPEIQWTKVVYSLFSLFGAEPWLLFSESI
jgi:hypothetical protein